MSHRRLCPQQFRVLWTFMSVTITLWKHRENVFYCFYQIKAQSNFLHVCFKRVMVNGFEPIGVCRPWKNVDLLNRRLLHSKSDCQFTNSQPQHVFYCGEYSSISQDFSQPIPNLYLEGISKCTLLLHFYRHELFLYLIVPFWYASAAYQASLIEPWFVFWWDTVKPKYPWRDQTRLICRQSVPKRYN